MGGAESCACMCRNLFVACRRGLSVLHESVLKETAAVIQSVLIFAMTVIIALSCWDVHLDRSVLHEADGEMKWDLLASFHSKVVHKL